VFCVVEGASCERFDQIFSGFQRLCGRLIVPDPVAVVEDEALIWWLKGCSQPCGLLLGRRLLHNRHGIAASKLTASIMVHKYRAAELCCVFVVYQY